MKKIITLTAGIVICFQLSVLHSQENVVTFLEAGIDETEQFLEAYLSPLGNALGAGVGAGWFNSAKPHKLGGFDITFGIHFVKIPTADEMFNVASLGLSSITPDPIETPTVAGGRKDPVSALTIIKSIDGGTPQEITTFNAPNGAGLTSVPVMTAGVAVGLPKGFEICGRYLPPVETFDKLPKLGYWGVGLKHDFMEWIPGDKVIPIDMSVMIGYTQLKGTYSNVSLEIADVGATDRTTGPPPSFDNQEIELGVNAFTANLLVSKKLAVLTPYLGFGIIRSSTDLSLLGNYPVPEPALNIATGDPELVVENDNIKTDPVSVNVKNTMANMSIGLRIRFAVFAFHGQYTLQKYPVITGGFGINFR